MLCRPECKRLRNKRPKFESALANTFSTLDFGEEGGLLLRIAKTKTGVYFADTGLAVFVFCGFFVIAVSCLAWRAFALRVLTANYFKAFITQARVHDHAAQYPKGSNVQRRALTL